MLIDKFRNGIIGLLFGRRPFNAATEYWVGLSIVHISPDGTGIVEPDNDSGYKRIKVVNSAINFSEPIEGKVTNLAKIEFPEIIKECESVKSYFLSESESGNAALFQNLEKVDEKPMVAHSNLYIDAGNAEFSCVNV